MAESTTGAQVSTSGGFSALLDKLVTTGTSIYTAKAQVDAANAAAKAQASAPTTTAPAAATDWRGTVATGTGITSKPWFPVVVIVGAVILVGGLFVVIVKGRKK